ncbi:MAG: hypothetical protein RR562_09505 [Longicatena sp.]
MPDYSIITALCQVLGISLTELMEGKEADIGVHSDDSQMLDLLKRTQALEQQRTLLLGIMLIIMGIALLVLHYNIGGSDVKDFISGVLLGLSIGEMIVGIYLCARGLVK